METNLKFKVGDKVRVKSLEWYNQGFAIIEDFSFTKGMSLLCGKIVTIDEIREKCYLVKENDYYWQDWMLEDEPVNAKQEDEKLNQSDMETKEMTKEEVFLYLGNTKILCTSTEETVKVQVKLFEFGIEWLSGHKGIFEDRYLLFINGVKKLQSTADISIWVKDINRQIEPNEILAIQLKEEKPKFDPQSLQPFDKVMVRDSEYEVWVVRFFDYYESGFYYTTSSACSWKYCVPYCDETKHLHKTTEEAPEYYKIWK